MTKFLITLNIAFAILNFAIFIFSPQQEWFNLTVGVFNFLAVFMMGDHA